MRMRTAAAWVWTGLILVACWIPGRWLHAEESRPRAIPHLDKAVHGMLFAGFGFLWLRALGARGRTARLLAIGLALAVLTELGQATAFVARDADPLDALADSVGLLLGVVTACLWPGDDCGEQAGA